ncbi:MBL fold metallo-hydrolase [Halobacteria archaeon AArc-curdl1]|uniref:MBL fold metallo-hydrolase n=1 Tax=Natronosalvus hydrolyticus TaxID=2979988 RepID=A0AAP3E6K3_9EURY|nr:MBL fold metallo-hydrolase [Halobacteria archaeon AArc-curdl1]
MVSSTWNDWFVTEEIEETDPEGLSIWYLGCNGFVLRSATTTVYIDPYFGSGEHRPYAIRMIPVPMDPANATLCDGILVTHEHVDHMHPPSYGPLFQGEETGIYAPKTSFEDPDYDGDLQIPNGQRTVVNVGDVYDIGDLTVHVRGANDPDAKEPVSYVVEHESGTFYHGGDSRYTDVFEEVGSEFDIDVGALAYGTRGRFFDGSTGKPRSSCNYMNGNDIIESANALETERLLPTHYDFWKGWNADPKVLPEYAASYPYPRAIEMISIGDRVDVDQYGIVPPRYTR